MRASPGISPQPFSQCCLANERRDLHEPSLAELYKGAASNNDEALKFRSKFGCTEHSQFQSFYQEHKAVYLQQQCCGERRVPRPQHL